MTPAKTFVVALLAGLVAGASALGIQMVMQVWVQKQQQEALQGPGGGLS